MTDIIYLYDGSFEGLLTCIHEAYYRRQNPVHIEYEQACQMRFGCDYVYIETDNLLSDKVFYAIINKISYNALHNVYYTYLSEFKDKEKRILEYLKLGFKVERSIDQRLADDNVRFIVDAAYTVGGEAHKYKGLLRFAELKNGAFYSEIEPKHNVVPILGKHFLKRLSGIPWIIYDVGRGLCGAYDTKIFSLQYVSGVKAELSDNEQKYSALWKQFYDTIEIKERHNEKCRRTCMPKRYWSHLTEMGAVYTHLNKSDEKLKELE